MHSRHGSRPDGFRCIAPPGASIPESTHSVAHLSPRHKGNVGKNVHSAGAVERSVSNGINARVSYGYFVAARVAARMSSRSFTLYGRWSEWKRSCFHGPL